MAGVTTIALLERRPDIARSLFTRYWRDVHGVMAARIPGFLTYTQYHVLPMDDVGSTIAERFEGIAIVTFATEDDRGGLIHSAITPHIHRDERNVFRRALLYNLDAPATRRLVTENGRASEDVFFVLADDADGDAAATRLATLQPTAAALFDLRRSDPAGWNDTDVDDGGRGPRFGFVIHSRWPDADSGAAAASAIVAAGGGRVGAFRTEAHYRMVDRGRPTEIGLRGLDAVRTIEAAGAINQRDPAVLRAIYGADVVGSRE